MPGWVYKWVHDWRSRSHCINTGRLRIAARLVQISFSKLPYEIESPSHAPHIQQCDSLGTAAVSRVHYAVSLSSSAFSAHQRPCWQSELEKALWGCMRQRCQRVKASRNAHANVQCPYSLRKRCGLISSGTMSHAICSILSQNQTKGYALRGRAQHRALSRRHVRQGAVSLMIPCMALCIYMCIWRLLRLRLHCTACAEV